MASHSSILAWRIPWTEEPGGLQSMRLQRVGHDWAPNTFYVGVVQSLSHVQLCNPHVLQLANFPCPPSPGACSNSCLSSWWCHPTTSSSVIPFSSCLQSFLASGCFPVSQFFASAGQSIGASASASVLTVNIQCWFPLGLTGLFSFQSKGLQQSSLASQFKSINSLVLSLLYGPTLIAVEKP